MRAIKVQNIGYTPHLCLNDNNMPSMSNSNTRMHETSEELILCFAKLRLTFFCTLLAYLCGCKSKSKLNFISSKFHDY